MGLLLLWGCIFVFGKLKSDDYYQNAKDSVFQLAQKFGTIKNIDSSNELISVFMNSQHDVGYVVVAHFPSGYRKGYFEPKVVSHNAPGLKKMIQTYPTEKVIQRILQPQEGFSNKHFHVVSVDLIDGKDLTQNVAIGKLKVGFRVPGKILGLSFGRMYTSLIQGLLLVWLMFFLWVVRSHNRKSRSIAHPISKYSTPKDINLDEVAELTWLEHDSGKTEPIYIDDQGRSWRLLLPDGNIENWTLKGGWYVSNGDMMAKPWGSSAIRADVTSVDRYCYQLRAYKMAGQDGFVVLFPFLNHSLVWILGGWHNTRSELVGYPQTQIKQKIERGQWYLIEVFVGEFHLEGKLNGQVIWKIKREEVQQSSPELGFQGGLGVGVWNTLARYSDLRLYQE